MPTKNLRIVEEIADKEIFVQFAILQYSSSLSVLTFCFTLQCNLTGCVVQKIFFQTTHKSLVDTEIPIRNFK